MKTLLDILITNLRERPTQPSFWVKDNTQFQPITISEMAERIVSFSLGLESLGVVSGDHVAIVSNNRPEWVISDFAVMGIGACLVPVYPTLSDSEIAFILNDSRAKVVIVETESHLEKVLSIKAQCAQLTHIVLIANCGGTVPNGVRLFSAVELIGQGYNASQRQSIRDGWAEISPEQLATIVYTSGTTRNPKGVCLSHRNISVNVSDILASLPISCDDIVLSFLPLSHVFERTAGYYTVLAAGGQIYYAESINTVSEDLQHVHPTVVVSVPRLYEKVYASMMTSATGVKRYILNLALWVGAKKLHYGDHLPFWLRPLYCLMDKLVYQKLRLKLGNRLRFFVSGGAPLRAELAEFFNRLGVLIIEGYGMTETSPVLTCNRPDAYRFGSVGLSLPSVQLKLGNQDELLAKGPSISAGYWNRPDATALLVDDDGWLHTGDVAKIDATGFVYIVDRIKELIVLSNGKKVPPQVIETHIKSHRVISQVMVIGDNRSYLTALVVPNWDELAKLVTVVGHRQDSVKDDSVIKVVESIVSKQLASFASFEQVKKVRLIANEWSLETGEMTPSLKIKRKVILEKYADLIESMYC